MTKIVIKLLNEDTDRVEWVHLCYFDKDLYNKFLEKKELLTTDMNSIISRWFKEDFGIELSMSRKQDITVLKAVVKDFYRTAYPDIYVDSETDHQGWLRVWLTRKMKEDLGIYGNESI